MSLDPPDPARCRSMAEVRAGVDRLDRQIVSLLGTRFRYMDAAARIKPDRQSVRDEARKAQVLDAVRTWAEEEQIPVDAIALLYDLLIESSISYEYEKFDARAGA